MSGRRFGRAMQIEHLSEFLCAAHVGQQVESPFEDKGGIGLIADPKQFKTSVVSALAEYPNVRILSDMNYQELGNARSEMLGSTRSFRTMVFLDFQKIYERKKAKCSCVIGHDFIRKIKRKLVMLLN